MEDHTQSLEYFPDINYTYMYTEESSRSLDSIIMLSVLPIEIIVGVLANSWAFAIIIRRRLWLQHEGFVYLASILLTSALVLALHYGSYWVWVLDFRYAITQKADFLCKAFNFFFNGFHCIGFLVLALLFNVCLRRGMTKTDDEKGQPVSYRPSICALIAALSLILATLLINIGQLTGNELREYYDGRTSEYYCSVLVPDWYWIATIILHGLPIFFFLPVLCALIACSGCACTGCIFGTNSREHFPRGNLLLLAGIIYFLEFPSDFWCLLGGSLFSRYADDITSSHLFVAAFLVNGFALAVVPFLCIGTMPKLREAALKADCCSCGHSRTLDVEAIALRQAVKDKECVSSSLASIA